MQPEHCNMDHIAIVYFPGCGFNSKGYTIREWKTNAPDPLILQQVREVFQSWQDVALRKERGADN